jgi:hypothetical protein
VVTHPAPGQTVTKGGYEGGMLNVELQPGDAITINGRTERLLETCELPREENYDPTFGIAGLRVVR